MDQDIARQSNAAVRVPSEVAARRWALVLAHQADMLRIARRRVNTREDAEDVVATAMIRTVEHSGLDETRLRAFLTTTVKRLAVDVHRDRARQLAVGVRDASRQAAPGPVEETVCDEDEARWLAEALSNAPERERQLLAARVAGVSAADAAARLGLTTKAAENALTRLRHRAQGLVAATLAVIGLLVAAGRRLTKPGVAAVPAVALAAVGFAVLTQPLPQPEPPAAPTPALTVTQPETPDAERAPTASRPGPQPAAAADPVDASGHVDAVERGGAGEPTAERAERVEVRPPPVLPTSVAEAQGVYVEKEREEPFTDSLQRCIDGLRLDSPMSDPCRSTDRP